MTDTIFGQIMSIRNSGTVNMISLNEVQRLAYEKATMSLSATSRSTGRNTGISL